MVQNLKDLFLNSINSDIVISVKEQGFPAHKAILCSRSPVFKNAVEKDKPKILEIKDFEPEIVKELLLYMYCGETTGINIDNVVDLYAISSKFDVKDLKEECEKFLMDNESVEILCKFLILSRKYDCLKNDSNFSLIYLEKNASEVLTTDEWKKFESENTAIAVDILKIIVLENALKISI